MPTQAQVNANRLNAQKSTGPTTPAGEAISSLNALKSGIDAWSHIIPREDPTEFEALTAAFVHYQPADPTQLSLVDTLISAEWIQRRLRRIEAQLWNYQIECLDNNLSHADFLDASIQHNSSATLSRPSIPFPAFSAASEPIAAADSTGSSQQTGFSASRRLGVEESIPSIASNATLGHCPRLTPGAPGFDHCALGICACGRWQGFW